jgi:hypothetical protein
MVSESGVTAFTEYGHRVLEVRGVQFPVVNFEQTAFSK